MDDGGEHSASETSVSETSVPRPSGTAAASPAQEPSVEGLAPVIPLFGLDAAAARPVREAPVEGSPTDPGARARDGGRWHITWDDDPPSPRPASAEEPGRRALEWEAAERTLLKRLRARQLSMREARAVLAGHSLDASDIDALLAAFAHRGYLDDARLAEQVVHAGVDRKGQGRHVVGQTLAKRGIPRELADAALAQLPDDDADRALEYARTKVRGLTHVDRDTALRRLVAQLSRRGYPGSVAMTAARTALDEHSGSSGVRFV